MALPYFLNRTICQLAAHGSQAKLKAFAEIRAVVVLVSTDDAVTVQHYQWMKNHFPNIDFLAYVQFTKEKKVEDQFHNGILKVSKRSFNFFGKPHAAVQNLLKKNAFDLLINADDQNSLYLHVLATVIRAGIKVGSPLGQCKQLYPVAIYAQETPAFEEYVLQVQSYIDALSGKS